MSRFTVLIPVYNEADNIAPLHAELSRELAALPHDVVIINDGSSDGTREELARHAPEWTVVDTPRLGKSRALELGLKHVKTDRVVMMDGDLQDDTTAIPALLADLEAGADCAVGCRAGRKDGWLIKRFPSFFFNLYLSLLFGFRFLDINTGLKAFRTDALRRIVWFENCHRFFPLLVFRIGGRVAQRPTVHRARHAGVAKFNSPLRFIGGFVQGLLLRLGKHDALPPSARVLRVLPLVAALAVGATCFYWADREWYFANYDSAAFMPHLVSYATDGELINTFAPSARDWDTSGVGRQVGHGFLPSIIGGALAGEPTFKAVHFVVAGWITAALALLSFIVGRVSPVRPPRVWTAALLNTLVVIAAGYTLINLAGRPEVFVFLVATAAVWVFLSTDTLGRLAVSGLTLSILAVSHPIAALLAGLAFLAWLAASQPGNLSLKAWLTAAVTTVAGLALWFWLYPYPVADWFAGHLLHADATVIGMPATSLTPWFLNPANGLRGLLFATAVVVTLWQLRANRHRFSRPFALTVCAAVFLACAWYFALRQGFAVYNIEWLTPFGLCLVLALWWRIPSLARQRLAAAALTLLLLPSLVAFLGEQAIRQDRYAHGPSPDHVRELVTTLLPENENRAGLISGQYYQLFPLDGRLARVSKHLDTGDVAEGAFMLVSQADLRRSSPPEIAGWRLVHHTFASDPLRVAGFTLPNLARGLHYALYLPGDEPSPDALAIFLGDSSAAR